VRDIRSYGVFGRNANLIATLLCMGLRLRHRLCADLDSIGIWAQYIDPAGACRAIGSAAEWGGFSADVDEWARKRGHATRGVVAAVGVPCGLLLSTRRSPCLAPGPAINSRLGWRIPFARRSFSRVGLWIRSALETRYSRSSWTRQDREDAILEVIKKHQGDHPVGVLAHVRAAPF